MALSYHIWSSFLLQVVFSFVVDQNDESGHNAFTIVFPKYRHVDTIVMNSKVYCGNLV